MWAEWWVWAAGGLILAVLEVLAPGYVFLGFAIGAGFTALTLLIGGGAVTSLPLLLVIFAVLSLAAWLVLRRIVGVRKGQIKIWDRDVNED